MLSLVGSVLFTYHSGDCVSVIYLPFFQDFDEGGKYSWGSAVLAYLYQELCLAARLERKQIGGALLLLQMLSWERFPFGRPQPCKEEPKLCYAFFPSHLKSSYYLIALSKQCIVAFFTFHKVLGVNIVRKVNTLFSLKKIYKGVMAITLLDCKCS
jgi:Plant mobile domain